MGDLVNAKKVSIDIINKFKWLWVTYKGWESQLNLGFVFAEKIN